MHWGQWLERHILSQLHCDMTDICFRISPCDFLFILLTNHVPFMIVAADCQLMLKHVVMIVGVFTGLWYLRSILICLHCLFLSAGTATAAAPITATDSASEPCTSTCSRTIRASDATTACPSSSSSHSTKAPSSSGPSWCSASCPATVSTCSWSRCYQRSSGHRSHASRPTPSVSERRTATTTTWGDAHRGGDPADAGPTQEALGWRIWTTAELALTKVHITRIAPHWAGSGAWLKRGRYWVGWTEFGFPGTRSPMYELEPVWPLIHGSNCE